MQPGRLCMQPQVVEPSCGMRRRALFGTDISPSAFAAMMAGNQALPWEGNAGSALDAITNPHARALIAALLQCAPSHPMECFPQISCRSCHK